MTTISDVFAFAAQNADYWTDFLSGTSYPAELTPDEVRALEAAKQHVDKVVVDLLHGSGAELARLEQESVANIGSRVLQQAFKAAVTARNRRITLPSPGLLSPKLYRVEIAIDRAEDERSIALYASLVVKKQAHDALRRRLAQRNIPHVVDDFHVYASSIALSEGALIASLATAAATRASNLLDALRDAAPSAAAIDGST